MPNEIRMVSCPDLEYHGSENEHLWLLVGGEDHSDRAMAFYLGQDKDIDGDDLAEAKLTAVIKSENLDVEIDLACEAIADHRRSRGA